MMLEGARVTPGKRYTLKSLIAMILFIVIGSREMFSFSLGRFAAIN